jgi:hypothetical protein
MTFLNWLIRLVIVAFVLRLVLRLFGAGKSQVGTGPRQKRVERAGGALVQDPQCGTYIPMARALTVGRGADAKHFCSTACRDQYLSTHGHRHAS